MAHEPLTPTDGGPGAIGTPDRAGGGGLVLVVGDVIDDIVVRPLTAVAHGSDTTAEIRSLPGGSAANTAAWLGALGAPVRMAGRVGTAGVAGHSQALAAHGVEPRLAADPHLPTGAIVLLVGEDAERTMFVERGANTALSAEDLPDALLSGVRMLHVSGYSLFEPSVRTAVLDLVRRARSLHVTVTLDPGSVAFLHHVSPAAFLGWTADVVATFPNLDEARALTGLEDPQDVVRELLRWYEVAVVTLGPAGAIASTRRELVPVQVPAVADLVVDSTGAGDAFCAGFLATWYRSGGDVASLTRQLLAACLESANAAAARAVAVLGGRPPVPAVHHPVAPLEQP